MRTSCMRKRESINDLKARLKLARIIADPNNKETKKAIRNLQSRIANRERYDALRSLGLKKTPYGWE